MKKNWKETLKLWLGALLLLAESAAIGCKKLSKKAVALCVAAALLVAMVPAYVFAAETTYDIWVGGVQVTSANKDDITTAITEAGGTADGTATYDPESETLTLNGFSYTGQGYVYDSPWCAAIFAKNDLTVKVVGSNTVTASVTGSYTAEALNVWGALTITGDSGSSLTLTGAGRDGGGCGGNLKIENVTVNATGTSGLSSGEGNITINNAEVTATATTNQMQYAAAIYAYEGNITIENSTVTANAPHANAVYSYKDSLRYTIKNSNVTISAAEMGIGLTVGTRLFVENSTVEVTSDAGLAIVNDQNNFGAVPRFTGTHVVYAGDDAGSATEADASADATYANKYVKIEPVCTVTVNYGIDGVNNKEIAVTKGDTISLENPVIDGYIFMGWYADENFTTAFDFDTPITAATTIYAKLADYEGDKKALQNSINALETAVGNVETALNNKVSTDKLTEEVGKLNQAIADAKTYADTQDAALKTTLEAADATMNAAITELQNRVTALETGLTTANGKIDTNTTDINNLKTNVSTLETWKTEAQNAITALQGLTNTQGTSIFALQAAVADLQTAVSTANSNIAAAEARIAVLDGKVTDLETATANLRNAVTALQAAVAGKADTATVNAAIAELQTAINALETAKNNYVGADDALRTELEGKIATAKGEAISAAETLVNNAKTELQSKIHAKADAATTTAAIQNLQAAVAALEAVKDDYATADAALKTELEGKISAAQTAAISAAETLVNNAKSELQSAIDTKADAATVNAAIANLQNAITALQNAKDNYIAADAALKAELEEKIAKAKQEAIDAAKGHIPYIGTNGNWWIGDIDTGVDANGIKGDTGNGIASITTKKENGVTTVTITFTDSEKEPVAFTISNGETGATGADGVGIAKIEKTATDGNVDTYTITLTNGKTYTFTVTNGKDGVNGKDGENGKDGADGKDGLTPFIGENGNWWIGDTDTGVKAVAEQTAQKGTDTITVVSIVVASVALLSNLALVVWIVTKKKKVLV